MFVTFQCDFDHNSMRTRSIFNIVEYLNRIHFELQKKSSFVYFTYWMQMLLKCEIDEIAKRVRNHWNSDFDTKILAILSNLILILRTFDKVFFKKTFEFTCKRWIHSSKYYVFWIFHHKHKIHNERNKTYNN